MLRVCSALLLLLTAAPVRAELTIEDVKATYGPFGPERKSFDSYPFDELFIRFTIRGATVDAEGKVDAAFHFQLSDADGKVLVQDKRPFTGILALGGKTLPGTSSLRLSKEVKPGEYTWKVTVTDNLASQSATTERKLTIKPPEFAVVATQFSYDAEGRVPAPAGGVVGQHLFFRFRAIGIDFAQGKVDAEMTVQVLDADGKETMPQELRHAIKSNNAEQLAKTDYLTFNGHVVLNREGMFTVRIHVRDHVGNHRTQIEIPIRATAP
jgi:hypothetical protein